MFRERDYLKPKIIAYLRSLAKASRNRARARCHLGDIIIRVSQIIGGTARCGALEIARLEINNHKPRYFFFVRERRIGDNLVDLRGIE
jgi:hypothetical protein